MNRSSSRLQALLPVTVVGAIVCLGAPVHPTQAQDSAAELVARGRYLVTVGTCNDCHTPTKMGPNGPEPDTSRLLSGHPEDFLPPPGPPAQGPWIVSAAATFTAWSGPWGTSFTANLTPDAETGLGNWTLRNFVDTIRNGRHMGRGRSILPPMPISQYKHLTDEDLAAIFAYLRTVPAVSNRVPEPLPSVATTASNE